MKFLSSLVCATLTVVAAQGQNIVTATNFTSGSSQTNQFNTNSGYERLFSVDGQPNYPNGAWQTTDPYNGTNGATTVLSFRTGWSALQSPSGNSAVLFGGYGADDGTLPGITNPSIYYNFTSSFAGGGFDLAASTVTYTVDFGIVGPSASLSGLYTNRDYFGFSLLTDTGASLASISFNPFGATVVSNGLRLQWEQNGTNVVTNGTTFRGFEIQYNALYRMTATLQGSLFNLSMAGLRPQGTSTNISGAQINITNYAVVTNQSIITGGALSGGFTAADFERASVDWELSSGNIASPGANYMIMTANSVVSQLSVIPEPGTWAAGALLLVLTALAIRRRRALAEAK